MSCLFYIQSLKFIIYKLPKISESNNELVKAGVGYYYFDPIVQTGMLSTVGIDSPNQSLGITVNQIYRNYDAQNVAHLMYSDSPPNDKSVPKSKGHTKGVVCLNTAGGFWLIHSVRLFPTSLNSNSKYSWPDNARIHGQSLLCISAKVRGDGFQKIVTALQYNCPGIYDHRIPDVVENAVKGLSDVVQGNCKQSEEDCKYHAQIKRRGGVAIDIFAKSKQFKKDIYTDFIAPHFKSDMYAQTWQQGSSKNLNSSSGGYKVENIDSLTLPGGINFSSTKDHSKWAITAKDSEARICIGDINRQKSQMNRGGGMVCMELPEVRKTYESFIRKSEDKHDEL